MTEVLTLHLMEYQYMLGKSRAVLVTTDADGKVEFQSVSKEKVCHVCDLGNDIRILVEKIKIPEDSSGFDHHILVATVDVLEFLDAPVDVQKFILQSGVFPKANWVRTPLTKLFTHKNKAGGMSYWLLVGDVKNILNEKKEE